MPRARAKCPSAREEENRRESEASGARYTPTPEAGQSSPDQGEQGRRRRARIPRMIRSEAFSLAFPALPGLTR